MELFITEDSCSTCFDAIGYKQKVPFFRGFIRKSEGINSKFFTSIKGFKINDLKEKALKIYGQPNHSKIENGIECCEWDFCGDYQLKYDSTNNNKINLHGKSIAKNSFGNEIYMYFRNNKLIGYVITNYTP